MEELKTFNRIAVPYGAVKEISETMNVSRDNVSKYLQGLFFASSKNYEKAMMVREYAVKKYGL